MNPVSLVHTSVDDCRGSLRCLMTTDPAAVVTLVDQTLEYMDDFHVQQKSRRTALAIMKRHALRLIK